MSSLTQKESIKTEIQELILHIKKRIINLDKYISSSTIMENLNKELDGLNKSICYCEKQINNFSDNNTNKNLLEDIVINVNNKTDEADLLFLTKVKKLLAQQKEKYKQLVIKYENNIKNLNDENAFDTGDNDSDEENMLTKKQINNLDSVIQNKNQQINEIYKKTLLVDKISQEVNLITNSQEQKLNDIESNVAETEKNTKEAYKFIEKAEKENSEFHFSTAEFFILLLLFFILVFYFKSK